MVKNLLPFILLIFISNLAFSQEKMRVVRTKSVDRSLPVSNVFVDEENNKWAANTEGVFQVYNIENGVAHDGSTSHLNILSFPDGNYNLLLSRADLTSILGEGTVVTTACYDKKEKDLWLGTQKKGVYQLKIEPSIQMLAHLTTENSKLLSNDINSIFIDRSGKKWIGTTDGALVGTPGKWEHYQRFFNVYAFAEVKDEVWASTDELIWWVNAKGKWTPLELDAEMYEGPIIDLDFDSKGRLWMASEIITHFNIAVDSFKVYGPSEYFTSQFVNRIAVDKDDAVWIATEDKGLYQIEREDALLVTIHLDQPLSCDGSSNNAVLRAEVFGDDHPYTFVWNDGTEGETLSGLAAGVYALTVTNAKGKDRVTEYEIPDPVVNVEVKLDKPADPEGQNGQATVSISGGVPDYTIQWDNGESKASAKNLSNGLHTVIVTDDAGCTAQTSVEIPQEFLPLSIYIEVIRENECFGDENAVINYHANGGKKPYTSEWSNGQKMNEATGLGAGTYTVTLTDAQGETATASVDINEPAALETKINIVRPAQTDASDGQAVVVSNGGTEPYSITWSNGASLSEVSDLAAGEYRVTVTDANGCTTEASIIMPEDILPLSVEITDINNLICAGKNDGSANVNVSGGKGPFQHQWDKPNIAGRQLSELGPDTYNLTVTDATGATAVASFEITSPDPLVVNVDLESTASIDKDDGRASVRVSGGTGTYTYVWDTGEKGKSSKKLSPGIHTITITDENGCVNVASFDVSQEVLPLQVSLLEQSEVLCADQGDDGSILAQVVGGVAPYSYNWGGDYEGMEELTNIGPGVYSLTVTDDANTTATAQYQIEAPEPIRIEIEVTGSASVNESNGKATAKVTGGEGKYTYQWDTGETTKTANELNNGLHVLTVTDENGCTSTADFTMTEDILPLMVDVETTQEIICAGDSNGSLEPLASGGKGPYEFKWEGDNIDLMKESGMPAGNYTLIVTDALGTTASVEVQLTEPKPISAGITIIASATTNQSDGKATINASGGTGKLDYAWESGETTKTNNALSAGIYTVTVTDENGCSSTASFEMTEEILPLVVNINIIQEISCPGGSNGSLEPSVSGGKGPFQYQWKSSGLAQLDESNLPAGTYTLVVTDATGATVEAQVELSEPSPIIASVVVNASATTNQSDGKATINASGGTGKLNYFWENGETTKTNSQLGAGDYTITVTDENGCSSTASVEMTEDILPLMVSINVVQEIKCPGDSNGKLEPSVSGGKSPFQYQWSSDRSAQVDENNLPAGKYTLLVTDATGATAEGQVELSEPSPIIASVAVTASATANQSDGKATVNVSGGTGKYTYAWDTNEKSKTANQLGVGTHSVTITDINGCTASGSFEMTEDILPLIVSVDVAKEIACAGEATGSLKPTITGGKGPFKYDWRNDQQDQVDETSLAAGRYTLIVTDATGMTVSEEFTLTEPEPITAIISVDASATTNQSDGKATVVASGGAGNFKFIWDDGQSNASASNLSPGIHSVTVTDKNDCSTTAEIEITEDILPLTVQIEGEAKLNCFGNQNASLKAVVKGGKSPFTYTWSNGVTSEDNTQLGSGTYSVKVIDAIGTETNAAIEVVEPEALTLAINLISPANTDEEDGRAKGIVEGGSGTYTYIWDNGETASEARELAPGIRTLTVTDEMGCSIQEKIEIKEEVLPLSAAIEVISPISCNDATDGVVEALITGGKKPYMLTWTGRDDGGTRISNLGASTLELTISDAIGQEFQTIFEFNAPEPLTAVIASKKPCRTERIRDGKATLAVSGGTGPYSFLWENEETTQTAEKLAFGINSVTITDAKGCITTTEVDIVNKILPDLTAGMLRSGQTIKIEKLQFEADSSAMMNSSYPVLNEIYEFLEDNPFIVIEIGGHTNGLPAHDFCDRLSTARAKTVADYMIGKGITPKRVIYKGYGKRNPIATNQTPEGRRRNQRVEVKILEIEETGGE